MTEIEKLVSMLAGRREVRLYSASDAPRSFDYKGAYFSFWGFSTCASGEFICVSYKKNGYRTRQVERKFDSALAAYAYLDKCFKRIDAEEDRQEKEAVELQARDKQATAFCNAMAAEHGMVYVGRQSFSWPGSEVEFTGNFHCNTAGFLERVTFCINVAGMELKGRTLSQVIALYGAVEEEMRGTI